MSWTPSFWVEKRRSERESIFAIKQGCHKKTSFKNGGHKLFWKAAQVTGYWGREWWDSWNVVHHTSARGPFDNFSLVLILWQSFLKILLWSCASTASCVFSVLNSGLRTIRAPHIYAVACCSTISQTIFHHHTRVALANVLDVGTRTIWGPHMGRLMAPKSKECDGIMDDVSCRSAQIIVYVAFVNKIFS